MIVGLTVIGIVALGFVASSDARKDLEAAKRNELRHLVETTISTIKAYHARAEAGALTDQQAQRDAMRAISDLRYQGKQYFWINDMHPRMLMHPIKPALDGKDLSSFKDPRGKPLFVEFVNVVKKNGGGFVDYMWPKPGQDDPQPKLSYVRGFAPWNWIVGTGVYLDDLDAAYKKNIRSLGIAAGTILLLIIASSLFLARSISRPMSGMTRAMHEIASGNIDTDVPARNRKDEIGKMASALEIFRQTEVDRRKLEADQVQQAESVTEERRNMLHSLATDFETNVGSIVENVASASSGLTKTARSMSGISEAVTSQAEAVSSASAQASSNVQTVASATEQMSSSIAQINQQVTDALQASRQAVEDMSSTSTEMETLSETSDKIGEVVAMISDIAEQTNLLALNATIESARAGEAGKGFAVVATEVKALANETAKATENISDLIAAVQDQTKSAVASIDRIGSAIRKLEDTSASIASAMEEQGATTQEVARTIAEAASRTQDVSTSIADVNRSAQDAGAVSGEVLIAADELSKQSDLTKEEIKKFLEQVRAA